jgi:ORF6N domain
LPAELYGVETKLLKEQVQRNIERFPEDFMFRLTKSEKQELVTNCDRLDRLKPKLSDEEFENLRSQIVTSSWGGMCRGKP